MIIENVTIFKAHVRPGYRTSNEPSITRYGSNSEDYPEFDVPTLDFGPDWCRKAVAKFHERKAANYLPPVHIGHHTVGKPGPAWAGYVREMEYREDSETIVVALHLDDSVELDGLRPSVEAQGDEISSVALIYGALDAAIHKHVPMLGDAR